MPYALDTWVVIDYLDGREPSVARVLEVLAEERPLMSWINLGEVAYVLQRRVGAEAAREHVAEMRGTLTLDLPTPKRVLEAAAIKAEHTISYADAFAVAAAAAYGAVLLTGDAEILDGDPSWKTEDLRPHA